MQDFSDGGLKEFKHPNEITSLIPDPVNRGPVFTEGEKLFVKGGYFQVKSFGSKCLVLKGLPRPQKICMLCPESKRMGYSYCTHCGRELKYFPE